MLLWGGLREDSGDGEGYQKEWVGCERMAAMGGSSMDVKLTETYFVVTHVWVFFGLAVLAIVPLWPIFRKAGFPGGLSLLMFVPVVNLVVLYVVGFSRRRTPTHAR